MILPLFSGKLKNLKEIDASKNQIQEFPVSLATLARLNSIDLNENKIKSIPDGVDGLQITELSLNQNQISSISPGKYSVPNLDSLVLKWLVRFGTLYIYYI